MQPVFLVGPTAVGKSAVAMELARLIGMDSSAKASAKAEIASADSMQVYRGMDIGTAKATASERRRIRHHLIDVCEVNQPFDVKRFVDLATKTLADIQARGNTPLIVGGTGLYLRALRHGLFEGPPRDEKLRAKLEMMSAETLFAELQRIDPQTAGTIDRHNPRRLVRALEVFYLTGKPISELQIQWTTNHRGKNAAPTKSGSTAPTARGSDISFGKLRTGSVATGICLNRDREDLYLRIERRIDEQIAAGWVEEVKRLLTDGLEKNATAMQAAGYRELVAHLRGELTLTEAVALIKTRTRQLARRQLTWFRREPDLEWIEIKQDELPETTAQRILKKL
jgi:tRNA dimethylallyltransferase